MTDVSRIPGWGVDADPGNDPTYPMKERNNAEHAGYTWSRPAQQRASVEVLHSNERPNLSATFGTSTPPSGLSGAIRRFAFHYSESSYGHWLPLMLADRVASAEGVLDDLAHGHVPNIFAERGWAAEWRHNRTPLVTRTVAGALVLGAIGAGIWYLTQRPKASTPVRRPRPRMAQRAASLRGMPLNPS